MLRDWAVFHDRRFLQINPLLFLLLVLLVLSVLTLFAVMEHAKLEQIDFGATVHASFNELEPIHIPLQRTIAPLESQPRKDGVFVLLHTRHKGLKGFKMTSLHRCQPGIKLLTCAL